jgi:hypothetical protein
MREDARRKGLRLLMDGRLTVLEVSSSGLIHAECKGDSGELYSLGFDPWKREWRCGCQARTKCSHLWALQTVTVAVSRNQVNGVRGVIVEYQNQPPTAAPAT